MVLWPLIQVPATGEFNSGRRRPKVKGSSRNVCANEFQVHILLAFVNALDCIIHGNNISFYVLLS